MLQISSMQFELGFPSIRAGLVPICASLLRLVRVAVARLLTKGGELESKSSITPPNFGRPSELLFWYCFLGGCSGCDASSSLDDFAQKISRQGDEVG